jgi:hypothetical protein
VAVHVYFHDYTEVDPRISWTGLCSELAGATYVDITTCRVAAVTSLFDYARPDVVITVNNFPVLSLEQTVMNPSGHNIPQRFSSCVRAAELGVPSILYYPEYAKRKVSDPNPRYVNIRVPLAQTRMTETYQVPSLSVFWPTDPLTQQPTRGQAAQRQMADTAGALIANAGRRQQLVGLPEVQQALADMRAVSLKYASRYRDNASVRRHFSGGLRTDRTTGLAIDPPDKGQLWRTQDYLDALARRLPNAHKDWQSIEQQLLAREYTLVWTGTANAQRTDSEHPWPGYLTLLDVLYTRRDGALFTHLRDHNLVYMLPDVSGAAFISRMNRNPEPTATNIVDTFSDLVVLPDAVAAGKPVRGASAAVALLRS